MVAHNPFSVALPLLPLVLCCAASLRVRLLYLSSFFSIPLIFCNWSSIMVYISISTTTTHRFMDSVGLATQPGYRVSCRRASAMLHHGCSLIASSLTRLSRKSSGARRSADSIWSQTRHLSLASTPSYQLAVSATSASIRTPTSLCRSTSPRLHRAVSVLCASGWAYLSVPMWSGTVLSVSRSSPRRRCWLPSGDFDPHRRQRCSFHDSWWPSFPSCRCTRLEQSITQCYFQKETQNRTFFSRFMPWLFTTLHAYACIILYASNLCLFSF